MYDKIIIGAGLYGIYSAHYCGQKGEKILVLEYDDAAFSRATFINQARVHMGYHYPRSYSTAVKSAGYFNKFNEDYGFCINREFDKVYAISKDFSWTNAAQFQKFSDDAGIKCQKTADVYFNEGLCDGVFLTREYTYDANILKEHLLKELAEMPNVEICYGARISTLEKKEDIYVVNYNDGKSTETSFLLNTTYASVNQILDKLGFEKFKIKYELCEIILCHVSDNLKHTGITVMDGPFFSIMPFGKTGFHSLTSVTFTPHMACKEPLPEFPCQKQSGGYCSPQQLGNCNTCPAKPQSAWPYMSSIARKYLKEEYLFTYAQSLFSVKPILLASEIDDSRPTVVKKFSSRPTFISVLSGKINTVYDLNEILNDGNQ